jgi:hypothetical protein
MDKKTILELHDRLLAINREAFDGQLFEVAVHALNGAMHCGEAMQDKEAVARIAQRAHEQSSWIDTQAPDHRISSTSANQRGTVSVFRSAARTAEVVVCRLHAAEAQKHVEVARAEARQAKRD